MFTTSLDKKGQLQVHRTPIAPPNWRARIDATLARVADSGAVVAAVAVEDLKAMAAHVVNLEAIAETAEQARLALLEELSDKTRKLEALMVGDVMR